jgi:hypothetical protein
MRLCLSGRRDSNADACGQHPDILTLMVRIVRARDTFRMAANKIQ